MDQVHVVRHKVLVKGLAIRRVPREMGINRNTVRKYLQVSEPCFTRVGEVYGELWRVLAGTHGEHDAARVLAKILAAVLDHDEEGVRQAGR